MEDNSTSLEIEEIETTTETFDENTTEATVKETTMPKTTICVPSPTPISTTPDPSKKVLEDSKAEMTKAIVKDDNSLIYELNEAIVKEEKKEAKKCTKPPVMVEKILEALHEFPMQIQISAASEARKGSIHKPCGQQGNKKLVKTVINGRKWSMNGKWSNIELCPRGL